MEYVTQAQIQKEKWKFYFVLVAWPVYLFLLPQVFRYLGLFIIFIMIFPGVYLFTWTGFLMHECWHKYIPKNANEFFYQMFSWLLLTDPQIYNMLHGGHHMSIPGMTRSFIPWGKLKIYICNVFITFWKSS